MRAVPSADGEFSISEMASLSAECMSVGRITANSVDANRLRAPAMNGQVLLNMVQPGLVAAAHNLKVYDENRVEYEIDAALGCGVLLAGDAPAVHVEGHGQFRHELERPVIAGNGKPVRAWTTYKANQHNAMSGFYLKREFFERFGEDVADDGLATLRSLLNSDYQVVTLPKTHRITEIARQNLVHPYSGALGTLFLESNTLAFVIEAALMLKEANRIASAIGRKNYDRVMHAREILEANLANPPKSLDLARQVGLNLTSLQAHFKAAFGTSIFSYIRRERLEFSRMLLRDTELPVGKIGYQVGFSSPAAFTAAYRRHFGEPPTRVYRRK